MKNLAKILVLSSFLAGCGVDIRGQLSPGYRREKYLTEYGAVLSDTHKEAISKGVVLIGMTPPDVEAAWGHCWDISGYDTRLGYYQTWHYKSCGESILGHYRCYKTVTFRDGKVISVYHG